MASFEFLAIILTGIGLTVSMVYYASVLQNQNKTRQAQLFMQSYARTATTELQENAYEIFAWTWEDFDDFNNKYWSDLKSRSKYIAFMIYLNGIGIMIDEGHLPSRIVYKMDQGGYIPIMFWNKFKPIILSQRKALNNPDNAKYLEYYAEEMSKLRVENGLPIEWGSEESKLIYE